MKIALVMTHIANGGGAYQLLFLARELTTLGHEVTVVTFYKPDTKFSKDWLQGITLVSGSHALPKQTIDFQPIGLIKYLFGLCRVTWGLWRLLIKVRPDVVQPHEWPAHWSAVLYSMRFPKVTVVWMCNDVWHVPGNEEMPEKRILFRLANRALLSPFDRWLTSRVSRIVVLDNRIKQIAQSYYVHTPVTVIRSGIDLPQYADPPSKSLARKHLLIPDSHWVWLCFSILHPHRRFEDVIRAFERVSSSSGKPMTLYIVGSHVHAPSYANYLQNLIQTLGLEERVILINRYVSHTEKLEYLASCNAFIFPNEKQTWGLAVIEAMALGKPCIVSLGAGVHEVISDGNTGMLYPVGDVESLAQSMNALLEVPFLASRIGKGARKEVFDHYSWTAYAKAMEQLL